jgi:hypothetical protein
MGPTIANSACTTLAASHSNPVASFVGTLTNYKICSIVPIFGLLNHGLTVDLLISRWSFCASSVPSVSLW